MIWGISFDWPNKKNYFISWAWDLLSAFRLWSSEDLPLVPVLTGFPGGSVVKKSASQCRIHKFGLGRSPGEGNGNPLSIFGWEIPWTEEPSGLQSMGLQKSQTQLRDKKNKSPSSSFKPLGLKVPDSAAGFLCKVYPSKDMKLLIPRSISNHICILA